jgi:redox-sensitive bicupin YhaK (pirin superfamily)
VLGVLRLARLMRFEFLAEFPERAFYVVAGEVAVDGRRCEPGQLAIVGGTRSVLIDAQAPSVLLLIAGAPLGERHLWWNFVAADRARLDAARERWAGGGFEPVPGDAERMPLPAP